MTGLDVKVGRPKITPSCRCGCLLFLGSGGTRIKFGEQGPRRGLLAVGASPPSSLENSCAPWPEKWRLASWNNAVRAPLSNVQCPTVPTVPHCLSSWPPATATASLPACQPAHPALKPHVTLQGKLLATLYRPAYRGLGGSKEKSLDTYIHSGWLESAPNKHSIR